MSRDGSTKKNSKTTRVWVRVETEQKARWKVAAKIEERSLSRFIALAVDQRAASPLPAIAPVPVPAVEPLPPAPPLTPVSAKKRKPRRTKLRRLKRR